MSELDSRGAPTDTKGQGLDPHDTKKPLRKQSSGKKRLNDVEDPERVVDRRLFKKGEN